MNLLSGRNSSFFQGRLCFLCDGSTQHSLLCLLKKKKKWCDTGMLEVWSRVKVYRFPSTMFVTPPWETGQWGPRPSHCGCWHWTVVADLSLVWFRVALVRSPRLLVWLPSVPIWGYLLEQCPVAMTLIPLLATNRDFSFTIRVWDSSRFVTIWFGTGLVLVHYKFGTGLVSVLYKFSLKFWSSGVSEWLHLKMYST